MLKNGKTKTTLLAMHEALAEVSASIVLMHTEMDCCTIAYSVAESLHNSKST